MPSTESVRDRFRSVNSAWRNLFDPYYWFARAEALQWGVPLRLVLAVMERETGRRSVETFEPNGRVSYGPMQVLCSTAREVGYAGPCRGLLDPWTGIRYGTRYLALQMRRHGNLPDAVSAYNAGSPTSANRDYVQDVLLLMRT